MTLDDDRQQLMEGQAFARKLEAKQTAAALAQMRDAAVRRFFGEEGIPQHLKEGWAVLDEYRRVRKQIGYPLPPGGCLLLGHASILAGCAAEMHSALAQSLRIPVGNVRVRIERNDQGYTPVADIQIPQDWLLPVADVNAKSPEDASRRFLTRCVSAAQAQFRASARERLGACDRYPAALSQPIKRFEGPKS